MENTIDLVIKIGSMALIRKEDNDLDYNIISKLGSQLKPGMILISSGATEIGRLDYLKRNDFIELQGDIDEVKTDYASQGQSILMSNYRTFINSSYSIRQVLVEHSHFNDKNKRKHIINLLLRAPSQNAIPIINYNDPVSSDENRNMELTHLKNDGSRVVECIDNDETASEISRLVKAKTLIILTSVDGILKDPKDANTIIRQISGSNYQELSDKIDETIKFCKGKSRSGSAGAAAKLKYALESAKHGTVVYIANAKYKLDDILSGKSNSTKIFIK